MNDFIAWVQSALATLNSSSIVATVIASVFGAAAVVVIAKLWHSWQCRRGDLTGEWRQVIDIDDSEKKVDRVTLKHNSVTKRLQGRIERLQPERDTRKCWSFEGLKKGNLIFLIFWTVDVRNNPGSYGTIQLYELNEGELTGFYIRPDTVGKQDEVLNILKKTNLRWVRNT